MKTVDVYIVIVTFNGMPWIERCLKSCNTYPVIVIDNASTDETVSFIESHYPDVVVLKQSQNLGFGQANNKGISYALNYGAEHVFLLNQDAYLVDKTLKTLINFQKENPKYWIVSPIHVTPNQKYLDRQFSYYMSYDKAPTFYSDFVLNNTIKDVYEVPFVNAAAWLLSKNCLLTVGGFDPLFFQYGEDNNYCQRVLFHGGYIGVLPHSKIIHDRENRKPKSLKLFSKAYYEEKLKSFKKQHANVNTFNEADINKKVTGYNKKLVKALCLGRFKEAKRLRNEKHLFIKARRDIIASVRINRQRGTTYLGL